MRVLRFLLSRIVGLVFTLFIIITITFFIMHAIPGGPYDFEDQDLSPEIIKYLEDRYHLNDPVWKQYLDYIEGVVSFDLGPSYYYEGRTVTELVKQGFPITGKLAIFSLLLVFVVSTPLGILAAVKRNKFADRLIMFLATLGRTIPSFVMATLLIYFMSYKFGIFPIYGADTWVHYILPSIALSMATIGRLTRLNRAAMLDVVNQDYIRTAYAKGVHPAKVMMKHALKNASIPMVTVLGTRVATLLTGSFIIEKIFAMPGIGRYLIQSISNRDYPTIMGITIFYSIILLLSMLLVDIIYGWIDPRVRAQIRRGRR